MSHRPINGKRAARMRKAFRKQLPAYIYLPDWLRERDHASSMADVDKLLFSGRVKSESHSLGIHKVPRVVNGEVREVEDVYYRVPESMRETLHVEAE